MLRGRGSIILYVVIGILALLYIVGLAIFAVTSTPSPSPTPSTPTSFPTTPTLTGSPTVSPTQLPTVSLAPTPPTSMPPTPVPSACICGVNEQPLYNTFPHPAHTASSFFVINLYNDNGVDKLGNNLTVWVTVIVTADARMEANTSGAFRTAYTYVYLDAQELKRGQSHILTIPQDITAQGRLGGGRIIVYYENPASFDTQRNAPPYNGAYPVVTTPATILPITTSTDQPTIPSKLYQQVLEFTLDVVVGTDPNTQAFIDYDLSAVDQLSMPLYIFGGYDPRTLPNATEGSNNNGFPCGKAYIGCKTPQETTDRCPTQIVESTTNGSVCLASFPYCQLANADIQNQTYWDAYCRLLDTTASGFRITQEKLDFFRLCNFNQVNNLPLLPGCPPPPILMPDIKTPTGAVYGCAGILLLENHCLLDGSRYANSTLDGTQCSAINRGLCFQPNFTHVPLPSGLSCSKFRCPGNPLDPGCLIPCFDYSCFGYLCSDYASISPFPATCEGITCSVAGGNTNCLDNTAAVSKSRVSTCNDSTVNPYSYNLSQNEYARWARGKGERFYAFSLDEEVGGGNQQCLYSTQLDIVIYPACNGTFTQ